MCRSLTVFIRVVPVWTRSVSVDKCLLSVLHKPWDLDTTRGTLDIATSCCWLYRSVRTLVFVLTSKLNLYIAINGDVVVFFYTPDINSVIV